MVFEQILQAISKSYLDFRNSFEYGKSSDEMLIVFRNSLKNYLGEYEIQYDYIWGKDSINIDGVTKNYIPQKGDTLIMDISVGKNGIWCDVCRTFFVGEPSPEQRKIFELVKKTLRHGHRSLRAGVRACEIYNAVNEVYENEGKKLVHHAGHRIGEKALLQPQFLAENTTFIDIDSYYTIESGLYEGFGIRLENDFLVKENGAQDLFEELLPLNIENYILK